MSGLPLVREGFDRQLAVARELFFEQGEEPDTGLPAPVLKSWQRCRDAGLEYAADCALDPADRVRLAEARERNARLLDHAGGIMEHVFEQIRASGSMVILADVEGMVLHSLGDPEFVDRAHRVTLQPGGLWNELQRGTNAIGTAIVERAPVEVLGAQHYLERNGFLTCSASPVFDACGKLVGVFDISGDFRSYQRHTLGLVRLSVQLLERRLFEAQFARDIVIALHPRPEYLGSLQEGLLAVSDEGVILGANPVARRLLGLSGDCAVMPGFARVFRPTLSQFLDRVAQAADGILALELRGGDVAYVQLRSSRPRRVEVPVAPTMAEPAAEPRKAAARPIERPHGRITLDSLATGDERLQLALDRARRVQGKDIPLLIQGESGVGKELFARAFHNSGPRAEGPFVALNCAAIPENLIESELFGYAGGAFTGARKEGAIGKIQQAHGGTLFLDEIGDMPLGMQARLLRVLQERSVTPVGAMRATPVDISLVCATHRVLRDAVRQGAFREDLYYRVNGLTVTLPALRERTDIRGIVGRILASEADDAGRGEDLAFGEEVMRFFERYPWPGNVRQLQNVIRVAVALLDEDETTILPCHLPEELFALDMNDEGAGTPAAEAPVAAAAAAAVAVGARSLDEIELEAIAQVMREVGGNVSAAARRLGVSRNTLYRKLGRVG